MGFPTAEKYDEQNYDLAYENYQERFANAADFTFYFVGNIDEEKLKDFSKTYLASLPSSGAKEEYRAPDFRPDNSFQKAIVHKGTDPKSLVNIMWSGETSYESSEDFAIGALGEILTIKLVEQLREEEAGVYGVGARGNLSKIPYGSYSFSISFPCGPENVDKLTEAALAEVKKIREEGPTDKDMAKLKETYTVKHKEQVKQNRYWLQQLETAERENRDIAEILEFEEKLKALSSKDIQEVAQEYLNEDYLLGILMPEVAENNNRFLA